MFVSDFAARFEAGQIELGDLTDYYLRDFHEHDRPLNWFDDEMKTVFEIDVFSPDNLCHRDHNTFVYKRGNVDLIVLRLEDIETTVPQALRAFLSLDDFSLTKANLARDKDYGRAYREFRKGLQLPAEYLTRMYQSKFARFFYSASEIDRFRKYWSTPR